LGTTNNGFYLPARGEVAWDALVDANFTLSATQSQAVYNVKAAIFGAIGDGVADDKVAIQAALTAAGAAGGGKVYMPPGTYRITGPSGLYVPSGVTFCGEGKLTVLKAANNFGDNPLVNNLTTAPANNAARDEGVVIENFRIDGNRANNGPGTEFSAGVQFLSVYRSRVREMWIDSCKGDGIYVGRGSTAVHSEDVKVLGNDITDVTRQGIAVVDGVRVSVGFNAVHDLPVSHGIDLEANGVGDVLWQISVAFNEISNCKPSGIAVGGADVTRQIRIIGNSIDTTTDTTYGHGIWVISCGDVSIIDNDVRRTTGHGIWVDGALAAGTRVSGNTVVKESAGNASSYPIRVTAPRVKVSGNHFVADSGNAIRLESDQPGCRIVDNTCLGTLNGAGVIRSDNNTKITIVGNTIINLSGSLSGAGVAVNYFSSNGTHHRVVGNTISGFTNGVQFGATTSNNISALNDTSGCTNAWLDTSGNNTLGLQARHVAGATPTGGQSGDIVVGTGKLWANDAGTWKSVAIA